MHYEYAMGVGECLMVEHACGILHSEIHIEGIHEESGEVDLLVQVWNGERLVRSERHTISVNNLGNLLSDSIYSDDDSENPRSFLEEGQDWF